MSLHDDEFRIDDEYGCRTDCQPDAGLVRTSAAIGRHGGNRERDVPARWRQARAVASLGCVQQRPIAGVPMAPRTRPDAAIADSRLSRTRSTTIVYPSAWCALDWIRGENATPTVLSDLNRAAERLGQFVVALRAVGIDDAPVSNRRGHGLAGVWADVRQFISLLPCDVEQSAMPEV